VRPAGAVAALVAALAATAVAGCGLGAGSSSDGVATLTVTRDYGSQRIAEASESGPAESETVLRFLDREADITTRYGGGFVQSINGLSGTSGSTLADWFFYVNGVESPTGAADVRVEGGDRIWWDYRRWDAAMRVPAVVGSWPQPLAGAATVPVGCAAARALCAEVRDRLERAGVDARVEDLADAAPGDGPRVLVGAWRSIRGDSVAGELDEDPATSGVFARFRAGAGGTLELAELDVSGNEAAVAGAADGIVAALGDDEDSVTWVVTAARTAGVRAAARLLNARALRDRYAVATGPAGLTPLPVAVAGSAEG
jgi:hypothetical protein